MTLNHYNGLIEPNHTLRTSKNYTQGHHFSFKEITLPKIKESSSISEVSLLG